MTLTTGFNDRDLPRPNIALHSTCPLPSSHHLFVLAQNAVDSCFSPCSIQLRCPVPLQLSSGSHFVKYRLRNTLTDVDWMLYGQWIVNLEGKPD